MDEDFGEFEQVDLDDETYSEAERDFCADLPEDEPPEAPEDMLVPDAE